MIILCYIVRFSGLRKNSPTVYVCPLGYRRAGQAGRELLIETDNAPVWGINYPLGKKR